MDSRFAKVAEGRFLVNVRGFSFELEREHLERNPSSKLSKLHAERRVDGEVVYFNRDPFVFNAIVDYYVTGHLHMPAMCATKMREELAFWEVSSSEMCIGCQKKYLEELSEVQSFDVLMGKWSGYTPDVHEELDHHTGQLRRTTRQRLWDFLEGPQRTASAKVYSVFITSTSLLSVLAISLATLPSLRTHIPGNNTDTNQSMTESFTSVMALLRGTLMSEALFAMDCIILVILLVDLILRFIAFESKKRFFTSALNLVGILTVFPAIIGYTALALSVYFEIHVNSVINNFDFFLYIMFVLEGCRVVYLLRMAKYYKPMRIILLSLRDSRTELFLLASVLLIGATLFGHLVYAVEMYKSSFWSIPEAIWWAVITMTTVGYGEIYPVTAVGKIVGIMCALAGILLIALPVPIVANNFLRYYSVAKMTAPCKKRKNECLMHLREENGVHIAQNAP